MAHAGTRNDLGTESRKSLIFRLLSEAHNPGGPRVDRPGLSDHPVRPITSRQAALLLWHHALCTAMCATGCGLLHLICMLVHNGLCTRSSRLSPCRPLPPGARLRQGRVPRLEQRRLPGPIRAMEAPAGAAVGCVARDGRGGEGGGGKGAGAAERKVVGKTNVILRTGTGACCHCLLGRTGTRQEGASSNSRRC